VYQIATTPEFDADLKKLEGDIARRIVKKLDWLSHHPEALRFPLRTHPKTSRGSRNTGSATIASSCGLTTKRDRSPSTASNTADRSTMTSEQPGARFLRRPVGHDRSLLELLDSR